MTNEEINKRIAKFMGLEIENDEHYWERFSYGKTLRKIPNYPENISDAWIVEEKIIELKMEAEYVTALFDIFVNEYPEGVDGIAFMKVIHATPKQRCLAALATMEEGE